MTIRSKLIYLLVVLCVLVGIVTFVSVYQLNELAAPLKTDIPRAIEELHSVTEMDALVNQVRYYDELLTQSARNYAPDRNKRRQLASGLFPYRERRERFACGNGNRGAGQGG